MDSKILFCVIMVLGLMGGPQTAVMGSTFSSRRCHFPAVYNFGDSNSDSGGISAAMNQVPPPNGETFFRIPSGRFCDGRLIIDFIAEKLKLPYLSAYLDSIGTSFRHGANFATGGSSIRPGGYSPFHLGIQISQFLQFKSRTTTLFHKLTPNRTAAPTDLPRPRDFSRSLFTIDIGQNDLAYGFQHADDEQVRASIPDILNQFFDAVNQLYQAGARFFWIHNTGPSGCLPYSNIYHKLNASNIDQNGCVKSQNVVAQEFNKQLKDMVFRLRQRLSHVTLVYVDIYSVKYSLVNNAKNQGFVDPMSFCCGSYYGYHIDCGKKAVVNGTVYGNPCENPLMHISWDGIHYSEAANRWIAHKILSGKYSDPPVGIEQVCTLPVNMS